jgi:outer membrane protein
MRRFILPVLLLLPGSPALAEDLFSAYRRALEHDSVWTGAHAAYRANVEKAPQGRALLLPTLALTAATAESDQQVRTNTIDNTFRYGTDSYGLSLTQPLYRRQNAAAYAQGQLGAAQAGFDLESARQDLMVRVSRAYFGVLLAQDVLEFTQAEKNAIGKLLALARRSFAVGQASLVDVHEAQARLDFALAQEINAQTDLEARRESMRVILGAPPTTLARLAVKKLEHLPPDPPDAEKWVESALRTNPQVKAQEQAVEIAREEVRRNQAGHYPTLDLTASRSYSDAGGSVNGTPIETAANQIALQFQLPLYQGGDVSSKVRESAARLDEADRRLELARRQAAQQARDAYTAVMHGAARVQSLEQARSSQQRALETTLLGYERGSRTGVDVLNAQRELYRTQRDLSQARYDYLLAHLRLRAAAGTLNEADLALANRLLAHP